MNCNCCDNLHKTTGLTAAGVLTVTNPNNVGNFDRFCLVLTICPDSVITTAPVEYTVTINGTAVPVIDKWGYPITSDRLRTRTLYKGRYVTVGDDSHVTIINVADDIPTTTTAATETDGD